MVVMVMVMVMVMMMVMVMVVMMMIVMVLMLHPPRRAISLSGRQQLNLFHLLVQLKLFA